MPRPCIALTAAGAGHVVKQVTGSHLVSIGDVGLPLISGICLFFSSRRRHTRFDCDWSSDVCSSDLYAASAWATLFAYGTMMVMSYAIGKKYYAIKYNIRSMGFFFFTALAFYFISLVRSEEHTSELQSQSNLVCRLLLEKKNNQYSST